MWRNVQIVSEAGIQTHDNESTPVTTTPEHPTHLRNLLCYSNYFKE